jgi:hypothetical protein
MEDNLKKEGYSTDNLLSKMIRACLFKKNRLGSFFVTEISRKIFDYFLLVFPIKRPFAELNILPENHPICTTSITNYVKAGRYHWL